MSPRPAARACGTASHCTVHPASASASAREYRLCPHAEALNAGSRGLHPDHAYRIKWAAYRTQGASRAGRRIVQPRPLGPPVGGALHLQRQHMGRTHRHTPPAASAAVGIDGGQGFASHIHGRGAGRHNRRVQRRSGNCWSGSLARSAPTVEHGRGGRGAISTLPGSLAIQCAHAPHQQQHPHRHLPPAHPWPRTRRPLSMVYGASCPAAWRARLGAQLRRWQRGGPGHGPDRCGAIAHRLGPPWPAACAGGWGRGAARARACRAPGRVRSKGNGIERERRTGQHRGGRPRRIDPAVSHATGLGAQPLRCKSRAP